MTRISQQRAKVLCQLMSQSRFRLWKDPNHYVGIHTAAWLTDGSISHHVDESCSQLSPPLQPYTLMRAGGAEQRVMTNSHYCLFNGNRELSNQFSFDHSVLGLRAGQLQHDTNAVECKWVCIFVFCEPQTSPTSKQIPISLSDSCCEISALELLCLHTCCSVC